MTDFLMSQDEPKPDELHDRPVIDRRIGETVTYRLSADNLWSINRAFGRHTFNGLEVPVGALHAEGQEVPLIITRVHEDGTFNGQALLDGNCSIWVVKVPFGDGPGTWSF